MEPSGLQRFIGLGTDINPMSSKIMYYQGIPFDYNPMDYNCEYYRVLRDENKRYHLNFFRGLVNELKLMVDSKGEY